MSIPFYMEDSIPHNSVEYEKVKEFFISKQEYFGKEAESMIPAFLTKTFEIMHNPLYAPYISWNETNDAIRINDVFFFNFEQMEGFQKNVAPNYFKHSNFASFVRQLNMYGFHKTKQGIALVISRSRLERVPASIFPEKQIRSAKKY